MWRDLGVCGVYCYMIWQIRNPLVKQLVYACIGFCVLTGIVFALIYPDYAESDGATVSGGIILSMIIAAAFGCFALLIIIMVRSVKYGGGGSGGWGEDGGSE